jgi:hypothetical protein
VPIVLALVALLWPRRRLTVNGHVLWKGFVTVLEAALLATAALAALLTVGSIVTLKAGTMRLADPDAAVFAWIACWALAILGATLWRFLPPGIFHRHARAALALFIAAAAWTAFTETRSVTRAGDGLRAEYFDNAEWRGAAKFSGGETRFSAETMKYRWGGTPPDQFSARWSGFLTVRQAGTYFFRTTDRGCSSIERWSSTTPACILRPLGPAPSS